MIETRIEKKVLVPGESGGIDHDKVHIRYTSMSTCTPD